ncbi:MAG TPA: DNA polymerase III subunit delta [Candidatus Binatia bacterium]
MKRDLASVLADLKNSKKPGLLLLSGDDLQVKQAAKAILDLLVPKDQRGFNFEPFDGRSAPWDQIEAALMTPPFFPGRKVIWVENAPYFFSREQKSELGEKVFQLWTEGNKDEAAKLLIDLLVVEGWTQAQWERWDPASTGALETLLDANGADDRTEVESLIDYCKSRGVDLEKRRSAEGHRLFELIERGVPDFAFLILTAVQVDRRTRLYKKFEEIDAVLHLGLERDRTGKVSREQLLEFVNDRLRAARKTLESQAREMLLMRCGTDLRALDQELSKLFLYAGDRAAIRPADISEIFTDQGQGWVFDLTRAIADRDASAALSELARLLAQGEHPLKLLATIASDMRRLLVARQLLDSELRTRWKRGMTYQQFQQSVLRQGAPLVNRNPYADYLCFQRADNFSIAALRTAMERIYEADLSLKSSASMQRLVMERLIIGMCLGTRLPPVRRKIRTPL